MKLRRTVIAAIILVGIFQPSWQQDYFSNQFLIPINEVANQIKDIIPDRTRYSTDAERFFDDQPSFIFNNGTQNIRFFRPKINFGIPSAENKSYAYGPELGLSEKESNFFGSAIRGVAERRGFFPGLFERGYVVRKDYPYTIVGWQKPRSAEEASKSFLVQVAEKNSSFEYEKSSKAYYIRSKSLNITYYVTQTHGNEGFPTICKLYFYVCGDDQTSRILAKHDISAALHCRSDGEKINSTSIREVMKTVVDSLPRVLCYRDGTTCSDDEYDCRCGRNYYEASSLSPTCIPEQWRCDGKRDCPDGRDEDNCICPPGFFQCGCDMGGKCDVRFHCIPNSYRCDGVQDCESYKDERVGECGFNCSESPSIRGIYRCDGKRDCPNFDDEKNCDQAPPGLPYACACAKNDFSCTGDVSFYSDKEKCDGKKFCSDFSDEWNCTCPTDKPVPCNCNDEENFNCEGEYACYSNSTRCDLFRNCEDGTDEAGCFSRSCQGDDLEPCDCNRAQNFSCKGDYYCYSKSEKCDGWSDCSDGSDEKDCDGISTETNSYLKHACACGHKCPVVNKFNYTDESGNKVEIYFAITRFTDDDGCDGYVDCFDGSDENCSNNCWVDQKRWSCACNQGESTCDAKTPKCLNDSVLCDGKADCGDKSDEWNCPCDDSIVNMTECRCKFENSSAVCVGDDQCFTEGEKCNGERDCLDWTDEVADCRDCPSALFPNPCGCNTQEAGFTCTEVACYSNESKCNEMNECQDWSDERNCSDCKFKNCDCSQNSLDCVTGPNCFNESQECDGIKFCPDGSDEAYCSPCPPLRNFSCACNDNDTCPNDTLQCYTETELCNGHDDCHDYSDEWNCTCSDSASVQCDCRTRTDQSVCIGENTCYSPKEKCNGVGGCPDFSDEWNCSCRTNKNNSCPCKHFRNESVCIGSKSCYSDAEICDGKEDCDDGYDEMNCTCDDSMFTCGCFSFNGPRCSKSKGCINETKLNDGQWDCEIEKNDEKYMRAYYKRTCGSCNVTIYRLNDSKGCDEIATCDKSTCKEVLSSDCNDLDCNKTDFICLSECINNTNPNCKTFFQCNDSEVFFIDSFCDGNVDCEDETDEISSDFGFKCRAKEDSERSCVLPQRNLEDEETYQCFDFKDSCQGNFGCFDCVSSQDGEKFRISNRQVCDGFIDCPDLSDECLCRNNFEESVCKGRFKGNNYEELACVAVNKDCVVRESVHISEATCGATASQGDASNEKCYSKNGEINPKYCDLIPECADFEDECNKTRCGTDLPEYCNDPCRKFFKMGDRYCNGIDDEAWEFIRDNNTCPKGFDEKQELCHATRFRCPVDANSIVPRVSIPIAQRGDQIVHCDDRSDEEENIFSSSTEMIKSPVIKAVIWVIGIITIFANASVMITTTQILKTKKLHKILRTNHILILNLSTADFLMGVYLLIISAKSVEFAGIYGDFDLQWRSSDLCTVVGTIAIISSETSCFIMTLLTCFRLVSVLRPIKSLTDSTSIWFVMTAFAWMLSAIIAIIPLIPRFEDVFVHHVWFTAPFALNKLLKKDELVTITCRYESLINSTKSLNSRSWHDIMAYSNDKFEKFKANKVGFYGETSVCMPRFFVDNDDIAGPYSIFIISVNFISFWFVCLSYLVIYKLTSNRPVGKALVQIQNNKMQKRIARLLVTDFVCWIPLCVVAYVKYATSIRLENDVYAATIAFFLPVNSALNPILYSTMIEKPILKCLKRCKTKLHFKPFA